VDVFSVQLLSQIPGEVSQGMYKPVWVYGSSEANGLSLWLNWSSWQITEILFVADLLYHVIGIFRWLL